MSLNQSESTHDNQDHAYRGNKWIAGLGPGLAIGLAIGLVTQNFWVGMSVGVTICITIIIMKSD